MVHGVDIVAKPLVAVIEYSPDIVDSEIFVNRAVFLDDFKYAVIDIPHSGVSAGRSDEERCPSAVRNIHVVVSVPVNRARIVVAPLQHSIDFHVREK